MKNPIIFIIPLLALAGCSGGDAPLYKDPASRRRSGPKT